jgi:hypothetical protein
MWAATFQVNRPFTNEMKRSVSSVTAPNRLIEAQPPDTGNRRRQLTGNHAGF